MVDQVSQMALETIRNLLVEEVKFLSNVGGEVEEVQMELNTIHSFLKDVDTRPERYDSYVRKWVADLKKGSSNSANDEHLQLRQTYAHQVEEHFVGMDKDIACLVSLASDVRTNRVISIYGMGGLGKTTLARKIYQNKEVQRNFEARAWVCVSQQFNAKSVLQQVLKQLVPDERNGQLANMEQNELPAFPIIDIDCKILLTTRDEKIASEEYPYRLDCLTEDQGWELLQKIALLKDHSQGFKNDELRQREAIGREMVRKCGRLPLAISVIGGSLRHKQTLSEWDKVNKNIDLYLKFGEGVGKDQRVKEEQGSRETLRDVAERYLSELAFRCMVQVKLPDYSSAYKKFESCRLHDLMRDLCLSKGEEEGFLKVIDSEEATHYFPPNCNIPRLAFHLDDAHHFRAINFNEREKLKHMRSLLILRKGEDRLSLRFVSKDRVTNLNKFKFLRILILEFCAFEDGMSLSLLSEVAKLVHLRYLSSYGCDVEELPLSICNLPYLHTLNLEMYSSYIKLPNMICKMKRLRHLFLKAFESLNGEKLRLDGLNELETLAGFNSKHGCAADIPKLTKLRKLDASVYDSESLLIIANHISNNESQLLRETNLLIVTRSRTWELSPSLLRKLFMSHSLVTLTVFGPIISCNLPCYEPGFCKNLIQLSLVRFEIEEDVMETFGKFPMLKSLSLLRKSFPTEMMCHANAFPQLKRLSLDGLSNLEKWRVDEGAMPNLSELEIGNCMKLEMMPDGLRHITTLQELTIFGMPKEFEDKLGVVNGDNGQDYDKICHIPSILIR
ncbi:hypothetical protein BUALT_Bualt18G0047900 [Buddleja alternifolia]|uniref:Disease resistance protein n=1 Tax=Buddleja alternifolia TaxID=168488 RepID=A0AAV6WCX0_9LAMI|nr:hypothetical protein BUALT_Bualt18G0047900 [Buddleja alternifolia]